MPSGKRARQQRQAAATAGRTPPPVRSKGAGGTRARQASPRVLGVVGGVVLVAVIAIVLAVVLGSGGGGSGGGGGGNSVTPSDLQGLPPTGSSNSNISLQGAPDANALFKGVPQKGLVLGKPSAPIEMELFIDVQCPICQQYEVSYLPTIVQKYIRTGKVQLHLQPWAFIGGSGSQSFSGRLGVIGAAAQDKGYEYAKVLYDNQGTEDTGWLTGKEMATIAASVDGLNLAKWQKDTNSAEAKSIASDVDQLASKAKVQGTPTILVGKHGGKLQDIMPPGYAPTLQVTEQALDQALANT